MRLNKDLLQKLVSGYGEYFIGNKESSHDDFGHMKTFYETIFFSPDVPSELRRVENIGQSPFELVEKFAETETHANIYLGRHKSPPFQWGLRHKEFTQVEPVTCNAMELIVACYENDITDYWEVCKKMKELTNEKLAAERDAIKDMQHRS